LRKTMTWAGFQNINRCEPNSGYVTPDTKNIFLNLEATK
jgi:hypothetical protein